MSIYKRKLGEEVSKEDLGVLADLFTGKTRLLKMIYIVQDEEGNSMDCALKHKDYIEEEEQEK